MKADLNKTTLIYIADVTTFDLLDMCRLLNFFVLIAPNPL